MTSIEQSGKRLVSQSNALVESCYRMTLIEKRLLLLGISKLNPYRELPDDIGELKIKDLEKYLKFTITVEEWSKYYGNNNALRDMNKAHESIYTKTFTYHHTYSGDLEQRTTNWFGAKGKTETNEKISLTFNPLILRKLVNFIGRYTQFDFLEVAKLNSIYSIRLYELLKQYKISGYRTISVSDFRSMMHLENKYKDFSRLNDRCIKLAIKEITGKTDIKDIRMTTKKIGRVITDVEFHFPVVVEKPTNKRKLRQPH